jgi:hypothetical protein
MGLLADMRRASQESRELEEYRAANAAQREQDIYDAGARDAEDRIYQDGLAGRLSETPVEEEPGYKERFVQWLQNALLGSNEPRDPANTTWRDVRPGKNLDRYLEEEGL